MPTLVRWSGASQGRADSRPIRSGDLEPRAAGGTAWAAPPPGPPPDPQCPAVCTNLGGVLRVVIGLFSFILRKRLRILFLNSPFLPIHFYCILERPVHNRKEEQKTLIAHSSLKDAAFTEKTQNLCVFPRAAVRKHHVGGWGSLRQRRLTLPRSRGQSDSLCHGVAPSEDWQRTRAPSVSSIRGIHYSDLCLSPLAPSVPVHTCDRTSSCKDTRHALGPTLCPRVKLAAFRNTPLQTGSILRY